MSSPLGVRTGACLFSFKGSKGATSPRCEGRFFASSEAGFRWCLAVLSPSLRGCRFGFVRARLRHVFCLRTGACLFSFRGSKGATSPRCEGRFFASSEAGFRWCLAVLSPSPRGCRFGFVRARLRHVFCLRTGACLFSFRGSKGATSPRCEGRFFASSEPGFRWWLAVHRREVAALGLSGLGCITFSVYGLGLVSSPLRGSKGATSPRCEGRFFASSEARFRWCLAVLSPSPRGCRFGLVRARLRHVFCLRTGACLFSFRGSKGATSPRCEGRFFASSEPGFRWCLAVLSPSPRGCRFGFVRARLRHIFCLRTGACLFSFRGSKGATSPRCEGRFFASSEPGFRWCLAVLSPSPRGCRFGFVRARLRHVFCLRTGACLFSFRGSKGATSPRCEGRFFASSEPGFRWCLAVLNPSPRGCRFGFVRARLRHVFCLRTGACLFSFRGSKGATSPRCEGRFFASSEPGFRWCLAVLGPSPFRGSKGFILGTLSLQGCLRNLLPRRAVRDNFGNRNFWQCLRTTQRLARSVGRPKLWHVRCVSGLSLELASARLRRESLGCGNFRETRAPRSVSLATQVAKNCGTLASFAACCWNLLLPRLAFGTFFLQGCAAKLLGTKNLAKHWRYAAF